MRAELTGGGKRRDGRISGFELGGQQLHVCNSFVKEIVPFPAFDIDASGSELFFAGDADSLDVAGLQLSEEDAVDLIGHAGGIDQQLRLFRADAFELVAGLLAAFVIDEQGLTVGEAIYAVQAQAQTQTAELEVALAFDSFDGERLLAAPFAIEPAERDFLEAFGFDGRDDFAERTRAALRESGGAGFFDEAFEVGGIGGEEFVARLQILPNELEHAVEVAATVAAVESQAAFFRGSGSQTVFGEGAERTERLGLDDAGAPSGGGNRR